MQPGALWDLIVMLILVFLSGTLNSRSFSLISTMQLPQRILSFVVMLKMAQALIVDQPSVGKASVSAFI